MTTTLPFPVSHPAFWRGYWVTLRPYLFFVSGSSGFAGLALGEPMSPVLLCLALVAFCASYGLGQALTDVFQTDTDALSSPYRPLVRGEISKRSVFAVSLLGLLACVSVFALLSPLTLVLGGLGVLGLLTYTAAKRRYWAGPLWNAWIVALLPVMGLLCASPSAKAALEHPSLPWAAASTLFTYAVFVLLGYFKDVEADRATGYRTLPVRFGRRLSVRVSAVFCVLGIAASLLQLAVADTSWEPSFGTVFWSAGVVLLVFAHRLILRTTRDDEAHEPIALAVRGYVLLRLGEAVLVRPELTPVALALGALFEIALRLRPCREQI